MTNTLQLTGDVDTPTPVSSALGVLGALMALIHACRGLPEDQEPRGPEILRSLTRPHTAGAFPELSVGTPGSVVLPLF